MLSEISQRQTPCDNTCGIAVSPLWQSYKCYILALMFIETLMIYSESLVLLCFSSVLALSIHIDICTSFCLALE